MERFWSKVDKTESCWLWTGAKNLEGYGQFKYKRKQQGAHRFAYELIIGKIPEGLVIDHLCRVRHCVNPGHLEAVTCKENLLRGEGVCALNAHKTHCKRGHEFSEDNLYMYRGKRCCRTCQSAANKIWKKERRKKLKQKKKGRQYGKTKRMG